MVILSEPPIAINSHGSTWAYGNGKDILKPYTYICTVINSFGTPRVNFFEMGYENYMPGSLGYNIKPTTQLRHGEGSIYLDTERNENGNLTCQVTDSVGNYSKSSPIALIGKINQATVCISYRTSICEILPTTSVPSLLTLLSFPISHIAACPYRGMVVKQIDTVDYSGGQVKLECRLNAPASELIQLSWISAFSWKIIDTFDV